MITNEELFNHASRIFSGYISNSLLMNVYSSESLLRRAIKDAYKLITIVSDDEKLREILDEPH